MPDIAGEKKVNRFPILVSGVGEKKLLCIMKLGNGTGKAMAQAEHDALQE